MLLTEVNDAKYFVWLNPEPLPIPAAAAYVCYRDRVYVLGYVYNLDSYSKSDESLHYFSADQLRKAGFSECNSLAELYQLLHHTPSGLGWPGLVSQLYQYLKESGHAPH